MPIIVQFALVLFVYIYIFLFCFRPQTQSTTNDRSSLHTYGLVIFMHHTTGTADVFEVPVINWIRNEQ